MTTTRDIPLRLRSRAASRGLTLVELVVVVFIIGLVTAAAVVGSNQLPGARLKRTATMLTSATKVAFTRATATSRSIRLVLDIDQQQIWLEESDIPMLVQSKDIAGTGGADPMTDAERAAVAAGEQVIKGPPIPKPHFHPIEAFGFGDPDQGGKGGRPLQRGIKFREVQTAHDDEPKTAGRAYLYFWPGGLTERASIQLRIGDSEDESDTLTLVVAPLTGKVTVKAGPVALVKPTDDAEASDRSDGL
jgi:general secretion pathway protein H